MCGIAGILGRLDNDNRAALARMEQALSHRGPDATGLWTSDPDASGFGCMLAHRRLSILDLSHAADQPMTDARLGQTIVFNGEIYNYTDIRADLTAAGEHFTSTGHTEAMLRPLISLCAGPLTKLRGIF